MKKIIKLISFFLFIILSLQLFPITANAYSSNLLETSESYYQDKTESLGIIIPKEIKELDNIETILKGLYEKVEQNIPNAYNYKEMGMLYDQIRLKTNGNSGSLSINNTLAAYTLQNSSIWEFAWKSSFENYNCYGYAINNYQWLKPGQLSGISFSMGLSISSMADSVIRDLDNTLNGNWSIYKTTSKSTSIPSGGMVVCIRKGIDDFHFMKAYSNTNQWLHKPGNTQPLKWLYASPSAYIWNNERVYKGVTYGPNTSYNSSIYYIVAAPEDFSIENNFRGVK